MWVGLIATGKGIVGVGAMRVEQQGQGLLEERLAEVEALPS